MRNKIKEQRGTEQSIEEEATGARGRPQVKTSDDGVVLCLAAEQQTRPPTARAREAHATSDTLARQKAELLLLVLGSVTTGCCCFDDTARWVSMAYGTSSRRAHGAPPSTRSPASALPWTPPSGSSSL